MRYSTTLSLTNDNKVILTDYGTIDIKDGHFSISAPKPVTNQTLIIKDSWIRRGSRNLLWLPQEFRSCHSAFHDNTFVFGLHSGQVVLVELDCSFQLSQY